VLLTLCSNGLVTCSFGGRLAGPGRETPSPPSSPSFVQWLSGWRRRFPHHLRNQIRSSCRRLHRRRLGLFRRAFVLGVLCCAHSGTWGCVCLFVRVCVVPDLRWRCVWVCAVFCRYLDTLCLVGALFIKRGESLFR